MVLTPRAFATDVVSRLRRAGFEAYWAGGCVRDEQMGLEPKDFDVATSARPEEVREVFGASRTLPIGAAFGVVIVMGPKSAGAIEVATFRRDLSYSDGRRPDAVAYCSAAEDAARRDFTINGLFFDPLAGRVLDYVGGIDDIRRQIIRAIGDPHERIAEDKLRMLRGVRFTSRFEFSLDPACFDAIRAHAREIGQVSIERIVGELRQMLAHRHRSRAARLLVACGLLQEVLPECRADYDWEAGDEPPRGAWDRTLRMFDRLGQQPDGITALALLIRPWYDSAGRDPASIGELARRLRLSTIESTRLSHLLTREPLVRTARGAPWPVVQRVLARPDRDRLLECARIIAEVEDTGRDDVAFCRTKTSGPETEWNPPPLVSGNDLKSLGIRPGPAIGRILDAIRDAQLDGRLATRDGALAFAREQGRSESCGHDRRTGNSDTRLGPKAADG